MARTDNKVGDLPESNPCEKYPGITPDLAAEGIAETLRVIDGKWKLLILMNLFDNGVMRFSELERAIPAVTQKMLTQQLRELEDDAVVSRTVYPEVPPRVEYRLTPVGQELCPALDALLEWTYIRRAKEV